MPIPNIVGSIAPDGGSPQGAKALASATPGPDDASMTYPRRRRLTAMLTLALVALAAAAAGSCSSARTSGSTDATGTDDGDGGNDDGDASTLDAPGDGALEDAPDPTDAAAIDARVDAPTDAPTDADDCPGDPCDYHIPCGCAAPLVCDIDFTDLVGSSCRAVNIPGNAQSTCSSFSECAGGFTCVNAGGGRRCEQFCNEDADCAQLRGKCIVQITTEQGVPIAGATTCSSNCNPLSQATGGACPANWKCGFFTINNTDIVDCAVPGAGVHNSVCTTDADCGAGTMCTTFNGQQRCRRVCNRTLGGQECAQVAGTTCFGFVDPLTVAGTEYGICAP
jgi:hypothetical protein